MFKEGIKMDYNTTIDESDIYYISNSKSRTVFPSFGVKKAA